LQRADGRCESVPRRLELAAELHRRVPGGSVIGDMKGGCMNPVRVDA
jgi:hypothetical protein